MKVYEVILDTREEAFKVFVPAKDEEAAKKYVEGNGEVVRMKEADIWIDPNKVRQALVKDGFGDIEADVVMRLTQYLQ